MIWPIVTTLGLAAAAGSYVALDVYDVVPGILTNKPAYASGQRVVAPAPVATPTLSHASAAAPTPVDAARAQAAVDALVEAVTQPGPGEQPPAEGEQPAAPHVSVAVLDATHAKMIASHDPDGAYTAASSTKIPTVVAALTALGPTHTFQTTALLSGTTLTLSAGGDQLLAADAGNPSAIRGRAGLGDLARASARELAKRHITEVSVALDDTAWGDQSPQPEWVEAGYGNYEGRISPIAIDTGLSAPPRTYGYVDDPALAAAKVFVDRLREAGITVNGEITRVSAPHDATRLAQVASAPLSDIVRSLIKESDNVLADGVCRALAHKTGHELSYAGGVEAVRAQLTTLGVDMAGYGARNCSGLADQGVVSASVLAHSLALALSPNSPQLAGLPSALPVAGFDGTLHDRLTKHGGTGVVRAKTGSLSHARSLTGIVPTASGGEVVFAVVVADYPDGRSGHVVDHIDRFADALAAL